MYLTSELLVVLLIGAVETRSRSIGVALILVDSSYSSMKSKSSPARTAACSSMAGSAMGCGASWSVVFVVMVVLVSCGGGAV